MHRRELLLMYPSQHHFVSDDTQREVVHCHTVTLTTHHLRCHVPRSTTGVRCVVRSPHSSNTQVSHSAIPSRVEDDVLRLDVSMDDSVVVQVFKTHDDAPDHEPY